MPPHWAKNENLKMTKKRVRRAGKLFRRWRAPSNRSPPALEPCLLVLSQPHRSTSFSLYTTVLKHRRTKRQDFLNWLERKYHVNRMKTQTMRFPPQKNRSSSFVDEKTHLLFVFQMNSHMATTSGFRSSPDTPRPRNDFSPASSSRRPWAEKLSSSSRGGQDAPTKRPPRPNDPPGSPRLGEGEKFGK